MKIYILLFFLSVSAFAQKAQITIIDPDINAEELKDEFDVHYGSTHVSSLPDKEIRDEVYDGIKTIKKWDELKKDIFFMDLKSMPNKNLYQKYPEISPSEFKFMKDRM